MVDNKPPTHCLIPDCPGRMVGSGRIRRCNQEGCGFMVTVAPPEPKR